MLENKRCFFVIALFGLNIHYKKFCIILIFNYKLNKYPNRHNEQAFGILERKVHANNK